jgi:hypothetical protein
MVMDTDQIYTAEYFANWNNNRLQELILLPPYEPKDRVSASQWVTGSIRQPCLYEVTRTFTVTGPKMKVCFGGCNWNRVVFAMDGSQANKPEVTAFENWLHMLADHVRISIWADPTKYKPGAISNSRFSFDSDYIKPANDPSRYPDELRCRLSTRRESSSSTSNELPSVVDTVDADLFTVDSDNHEVPIKPSEITAGSEIIPILKFTYYRNGERFGLNTTILKAMVYPVARKAAVDNRQWVFDMPIDSA